ncbi:Retrovirus-related Pol polyprotein from transposon TNT 1-94 [Cucumis melo var. makuwa]|uniref:Retrovirus-related Pol polyprotein from transposon TNT 1-94 n=1 Tax=Cucumis melo var. makuwa TaxID=1194695 RepID=A0A5D3BFK3_CUCMM|nr:Retrovirus-related Pol polyprotein from transposon TNT 1-94 [Cucumis melo var. makuwa]
MCKDSPSADFVTALQMPASASMNVSIWEFTPISGETVSSVTTATAIHTTTVVCIVCTTVVICTANVFNSATKTYIEVESDESSAHYKGKSPWDGHSGISPTMVQQQLTNFQMNFHQQIAALGTALAASTSTNFSIICHGKLKFNCRGETDGIETAYMISLLVWILSSTWFMVEYWVKDLSCPLNGVQSLTLTVTSRMGNLRVCEHCKQTWHTKENFWKLHGRPPNSKRCPQNDKHNSDKAFMSNTASAPPTSIPTEYHSDPNTSSLEAIAQSSNSQSFNLININGRKPRILDSGLESSRRMIGTAQHSKKLYFLDECMFRHCLVMFVFMQNNLGSRFPLNPTNLPNPLPLSIAMFGGPLESLLPWENVGLLPSSMIIPVSFSDHGREYLNHSLHEFLPSKGIVHQSSYAYTQQNKLFRCTAFVHNYDPNQTKFPSQANSCVFVSHLQGGNVSGENNSFSFIPLDPSMPSKPIPHNTVLPTNQVPKITYYRKNLRKEVVSPTAPSPSVRDSKLTYAQGTTNSNNYNLCAEDNIVDAVDDVVEEDRDNFKDFTTSLDAGTIPKNIYEVMESPKWKAAVTEEMGALEKNKTWDLHNLPKGYKTVGHKWTYGIDYSEMFSPMAKSNPVKILQSIAVNNEWPLHQLDVKNIFLNGDLEEVYMSFPPGFEV